MAMQDKLHKLRQRRNDYSIVFSSSEGQRVLQDILLNAHVLEPTFNIDPSVSAFNEGQRNVALRIMSILQYTPVDFIGMAKEVTENDDD